MGVALDGIEQVGEYWTVGHSADIVCRYALSPFRQVLQLSEIYGFQEGVVILLACLVEDIEHYFHQSFFVVSFHLSEFFCKITTLE